MDLFNPFKKSNREPGKNHRPQPKTPPPYNVCENPDRPSQKAIIYQSELDFISRCILDYPDIETGGQIFGYWTSTGVPVVMYVIGPGRNAQHNPTSFVQDQRYLQLVGNELYRKFRLQHIGEWHSHHQLGLAHPSGGDVNTMQYGVGQPGFPRLLLCIGNCTRPHTTVNPFNFHENTPREYSQAIWDVVDIDSPFREIVDRELNGILIHPMTKSASHGELRTLKNIPQETSPHRIHWLTEQAENVETMKTFVSMVQSMYPHITVKAEILDSGEPLISLTERGVSIKLPYGFPTKSPVLSSSGVDNLSCGNNWAIGEESLTATFGRWISTSLPNVIKDPITEPQISNEEVFDVPRQEPEKKKSINEKTRTERLALENQILSYYFHDAAFVWSSITESAVVSIMAYPFTKGKQCVIRITASPDFPNAEPEIQVGYYYEDDSPKPTLPKHISEIKYKRLSDLFDGADVFYSKMLDWTKETSIFKAYIIACLIVHYNDLAHKEWRDVRDYLNPLLEDGPILSNLIKKISEKINEQK